MLEIQQSFYTMIDLSLIEITDNRGSLFALNKLPFDAKRFFILKDVKTSRGGHAHKKLWEVLIAVSGSCRITTDDGKTVTYKTLQSPLEGVAIPPKVWRIVDQCSKDCVIVSLCSEELDEADYIRKYGDFEKDLGR